jgi:hypothetical protein
MNQYNRNFDAHGEYKIEVKWHTIICHVVGAWNYENALLFTEELKTLVTLHFVKQRSAWIRITDMSSWELPCPDATQCIKDYIKWENQQCCMTRYFCATSPIQRRLMALKYDTNSIHFAPNLTSCLETYTQVKS